MSINPKAVRQQMQRMQEQLRRIQEELAEKTVEVSVGGGAVRVVMDGHQQLREISIAPEVVDPGDLAMLQDLIVAAVNQAVERSREMAEQSMGALFGGLGLPGLL
ncbi:MAG: YbaB/EbfC family nucleoid-associated protein [Chloroflexia bacterium]